MNNKITGAVLCLLSLIGISACGDRSDADDSDNNSNSQKEPHSFFVGNITQRGKIPDDFLLYWNQITPETETKWTAVEGQRDQYRWDQADAIYQYAKQNNIPFKASHIIPSGAYPAWLSLEPEETVVEIDQWIHDFCERYPDTDMMDVVSEGLRGHSPSPVAIRAFGPDWIAQTFKIARKHCPNTILILNDYYVLSWSIDAFIEMAAPLIETKLVDAIGIEAHGLENSTAEELSTNLAKIAALGVPLYISEYDVAVADDQRQLEIMQAQFPVFYNHPAVKGITLWGYKVGETWVDNSGLVSSDGTLRPAMIWLMAYLKMHPKIPPN